MRRVLKWTGIILGSIVGLALLAALALMVRGNGRLNGSHEAPDTAVMPSTDSVALARGEHIMRIHSCQFCHGEQLEGKEMLDIPPAHAVPSNLTPGEGGVGIAYDGVSWDRAIRYGIGHDGRTLLPFMPYEIYNNMNDEDAGHLAAYLESLQPVSNRVPKSRAKFIGKIVFGNANLLPEKRAAPIPVLTPAPTAEYGKYLASTTCIACHGEQLQGGEHPDPAAPPVPPLPPTAAWTDEQFAVAMRAGRTPGRQLSEHMPWKYYAHMTNTELAALRAYIAALSGGQAGS